MIARPSSAFEQEIVVTAGTDDGVRVNAAVVTADGFVGTVTKVTGGAARVRLLTDEQSAVSSRRPAHAGAPASSCTASPATRSRSTGSRSGRSSTSATRSSPPARAPASSASLYPKGIPIGRVSFVGGLSTDLWQQVLVESDVDFSALDSVLVLVPRRPTPELP